MSNTSQAPRTTVAEAPLSGHVALVTGASRGIGKAIAIDVVTLVANSVGLIKRIALKRDRVPHFLRDVIKHSVLWPRNRNFPDIRCFRPPD